MEDEKKEEKKYDENELMKCIACGVTKKVFNGRVNEFTGKFCCTECIHLLH